MKKLFVIVFIFLLLVVCKDKDEQNGEQGYYPIAEGNCWDYLLYLFAYDTVLVDTGKGGIEITAKTTLDNGTEVYEELTRNKYQNVLCIYLQKTDSCILGYDSKADTIPDTILVLPIEEGKVWTVVNDSDSIVTGKVFGRSNVKVPAGSFNDCWRVAYIKRRFLKKIQHLSILPIMSEVKSEIPVDTFGITGKMKMELKDYELE